MKIPFTRFKYKQVKDEELLKLNKVDLIGIIKGLQGSVVLQHKRIVFYGRTIPMYKIKLRRIKVIIDRCLEHPYGKNI